MKWLFMQLSGAPTAEGSVTVQALSAPRNQFALLMILAVSLYLIKLDSGGLMNYDECFYAEKAKEMVTSGDWLTQRFAGQPDHQNPWLHIWIVGASFKLFGTSDWAARFPTTLQSIALVAVTFFLVQYLIPIPWVAFLSGSILLVNDYFYKYARKAHMDHLVALLFALAVVAFIVGKRRHPAWYLVMGLCGGLAVLTKSVLGFFPLLVVLLAVVIDREWRVLKSPFFLAGTAVLLALGSSWYLYEYCVFREEFIRQHVRWLLWHRSVFGGAGEEPSAFAQIPKNAFFYVRDMHLWFVLAMGGAASVLSGWRGASGSRFGGGAAPGGEAVPRERTLLLLWLFLPIVIMLFAGNFKTWYLMPTVVPLSILGALFLQRLFPDPRRIGAVAIGAACLAALHLGILVATPYFSLDMAHEVRHPAIRKLAIKVRMLDIEPGMRVVQFPGSREIAERHGLGDRYFNYASIAPQWTFYSDRFLFPRGEPASLDETRRHLDRGGVCLTTAEGYDVISERRALPYDVIARASDRSATYVLCCARSSWERWRETIETDYSRPPLYTPRDW